MHWYYAVPLAVAGLISFRVLTVFALRNFVVTWKLVRDSVPDQIQRRGAKMVLTQLEGDKFRKAIASKLVEEAREVGQAADRYSLIDEFADLLEVFDAYRIANGIPQQDINAARVRKYALAGGFTKGYFLKVVYGGKAGRR